MNYSEQVIAVLQSRYPEVKFYLQDENLVWLNTLIPEPTQEQIDLWVSELKEPPDWERLLRESGQFVAKAQTTTNPTGFTLLLSTLTTIRSIAYLEIALNQVRSTMKRPYTAEELAALNKLLADCNIELILT